MGQAIFITGASSGIGAALARAYAGPDVRLGLAARRVDRLKTLQQECERPGGVVHIYELDVTDAGATERVANQFIKDAGQIDLVIANAGVGGWKHPIHDQAEAMAAMVDVNVNGVIHTVMAFVPHMVAARRGHLVAMSSIAAFAALPRGAYAATKIAVRYLMDGWRIDLAPFGIAVTTIFPGFVTSEMTNDETTRYPFLVSAEYAARVITAAIARRKRTLIFPWPWRLILPLAKFIPDFLWRRALPSVQTPLAH